MDAAGDAITGAMIARAVEPEHGEAHAAGHGACLNCGTPLSDNYCAHCGQAAHLHRSFSAIGHDLAHGVLHFEGKIWTTLPELALRPGTLTRRYIHGERAKFVSPFALFLFSAFLLYAIFSLTSHADTTAAVDGVKMDKDAQAEIAKEQAKADAHIREIEAKLAAPALSADRRAALTEALGEARDERKGLTLAGNLTDSLVGEGMNQGIAKSVGKAVSAAAENPEFAYYKLKANAYKFSWALILISLPFVWLLFPFSRRFKIDAADGGACDERAGDGGAGPVRRLAHVSPDEGRLRPFAQRGAASPAAALWLCLRVAVALLHTRGRTGVTETRMRPPQR
jgi:hypothetical protein